MAQLRLYRHEAEGDLPNRCMCCGLPATNVQEESLAWLRPGTGREIFCAGPIVFLFPQVAHEHARIRAPLCDRHRNHWTKWRRRSRWLFAVSLLALFIGVTLMQFSPSSTIQYATGLVCYVLVMAGIVAYIVGQYTAIRAIDINPNELVLVGVSRKFYRAIVERDRREARAKKLRADTGITTTPPPLPPETIQE